MLWMFRDHLVNHPKPTGIVWQRDDKPQWDSRWALSLLHTLTDWWSESFGKRLDINAAVLPNYLARSVRRRLDSKASKSGWLPSIMCTVCWISIFNLQTWNRFNMGMWPLGASTTVIIWPKRPGRSTLSLVAWIPLPAPHRDSGGRCSSAVRLLAPHGNNEWRRRHRQLRHKWGLNRFNGHI